jgi:hypothetical protein
MACTPAVVPEPSQRRAATMGAHDKPDPDEKAKGDGQLPKTKPVPPPPPGKHEKKDT